MADPLYTTPVERREETIVTQQPGYVATEQIVRDVGAERQVVVSQATRIIYALLSFLEILLGFRFALRLMGANPASGFASFIYGISDPFLVPFTGLLPTPDAGGMVLEVTTLIAMAVYALIVWGLVYLLHILMDRPTTRSVTRSVHEQTPDGTGRTIHTISRD